MAVTWSELVNTTLQSDGKYKMTVGNSAYGYAKVTFTAPTDNYTFEINYSGYGEANYDIAYLSNLDTTLTKSTSKPSSGYKTSLNSSSNITGTVEYTGISAGEHFITILFRRDGSSGNDTFYFWTAPEGITLNTKKYIYTGDIISLDYTENEPITSIVFKQNDAIVEFKEIGEYTVEVTTDSGVYEYDVKIVGRTFENLESLEGLWVGDKIFYYGTSTSVYTNKTIDFAGYKVQIDMQGAGSYTAANKQGRVKFILDSKNITTPLIWTQKYGGSLCYEKEDPYYRIAVAGNGGGGDYDHAGSLGGGLVAGSGSGGTTGGSQTSAGTDVFIHSSKSYIDGLYGDGFGVPKTYTKKSSYSTYLDGSRKGGAGWYCGGSAIYVHSSGSSTSASFTGGGGSGFLIGVSTTEYPDGYLGNDTTLQSELASCISDGELIQGSGSSVWSSWNSGCTDDWTGHYSGAADRYFNNPKMVVTILGKSDDDTTSDTHSTFKLYSNSEWKSYTVYTYKDGSFKQCDIYTYNNDKFNKV